MKIHRLLIILFFASIIFCCSAPSSKTPVESPSESPVVQTRNDLPKMIITSVDESKINVHTLKEKTILILFQPDCDHCQREAKEIRENLNAFKEYTLYFISADQVAAVKKFGEDYDLAGRTNVYFATTTVDDVIKNFGGIPAPSVYIYTDQKLAQKFNGEVTIEKILQAL
jgi:peroxiredoxin